VATSITPAQAQAMFKQVFGDTFLKVLEPQNKLQTLFPFETSEKPGEAFVQAIRMTEEHGFTLRASGQAATTMNSPVALKVERATILGSIIDFASRVDVETMVRAMSSKQTFKDHVGLRMEGMRDAMRRHLEWNCLYGGTPLATVTAIGSGTTTRTLTIDPKAWAGGWWAASENMPLDITSDAAGTTKLNTNASIAVSGYDLSARTVTVTGNSTDLAAVATALGSASVYVWRLGGSAATEAPGIITILNTQSGTVNGISATSYGMWRGVQQAVNGQLTMAQVLQADAKCAERGLSKASKKCYVSPRNFAVLNSDLSASRRYDGSFSRKAINGFGAIEFYSPSGVIEFETHPYLKDGDAPLLDTATWSRVGPSDITFEIPGSGGDYFVLVQGVQAYEYRGYSQQGMLCTAPAHSAVLSGLVVPT
jgi:hypothetical protein